MNTKTLKCWIATALLALTVGFAFAQEVPKYLQLAREIAQNVKPENNEYANFNRSVRLPGDLFTSEYKVQTDCTGFVEYVLSKANNIQTHFSTMEKPRYGYTMSDWVPGIDRGEMFDKVERVQNLRPGDFIVWKHIMTHSHQGHIMIVDSAPRRVEPQRAPFAPGLIQWEMWIIDSSTGPSSPDDTRYMQGVSASQVDSMSVTKRTGVGRGRYYLYTDESGVIKAASYAFTRASLRVQDVDYHIVLARPRIK